MAHLPDKGRPELTPSEIIFRCQKLTDHIRRSRRQADASPSYHTWARVQRLTRERRELQSRIRPRLATIDGEVVPE